MKTQRINIISALDSSIEPLRSACQSFIDSFLDEGESLNDPDVREQLEYNDQFFPVLILEGSQCLVYSYQDIYGFQGLIYSTSNESEISELMKLVYRS